LVEAVSGQRLNEQGVLEMTKLNRPEKLAELRERLGHERDDDDWVIWGRWFLADPYTRTISPFSKVTVPQYIEDRIKENTDESLGEAQRLAYRNPDVLQRITQAREALGQKTERVR